MDYIFDAKYVCLEDDGVVLSIGFADDKYESKQHVLFQKKLKLDERDRTLGLDGLHIEVEDESRSGYRGISSAHYSKSELVLSLTADGRKFLRIDGNIRIALPDDSRLNDEVIARLSSAADGEFSVE